MIFQQHFPQSLSRTTLDRYLADGWFRCQDFLYRSKLVSFGGGLFSVVNIRLPLDDYRPTKSMRRVLKRNEGRLRAHFGEVSLTPEKERLYQQHLPRFKGRILPTLEDYLFGESKLPLFDTKELCIYDGDRLVAVSYFDQGKESVAGILGLYDQRYRRESLGTYTMLLEIQRAKAQGKRYYYPGYIIEESDLFDYKLRLGPMEYYDWMGRWLPLSSRVAEQTVASRLEQKIAEMERLLVQFGLPFERVLYSYFSMGYFEEETFVKGALLLRLGFSGRHGEQILIEFDIEQDSYLLSYANPVPIEERDQAIFAETAEDRELYCFDLLAYEELLCRAYTPYDIVDYLLHYQP